MFEKAFEYSEPNPRRLFETIESLMKFTNIIGASRINEALWLFHIDNFTEISMKECIIDVKLTKCPVLGESNSENQTDCGRLNNWTKKGPNNPLLLDENLWQQCFVSINRTNCF